MFLLLGREIIQRHWRTLLAISILWIIGGSLIVIDALDGKTVLPARVFGYFLLPEAALCLFAAIASSGTARRMRLVQGIALLGVSILIISSTPASNFTLAMLFGLCFLIDGVVRIASAWVVRYPRWRVGLTGGIVEVLIAIGTLQPWPTWYEGTVGVNVGAVLILTGIGLLSIAFRIKRMEADASLTSILSRNPFNYRAAQLHQKRSARNRKKLVVHVWTPTGTAMTSLRQRAINRYIAAVDSNGVISTGHAALEMEPDLYISHYPAAEIDRNPDEFSRTLRATADNNVPGRFLPSYEFESGDWCSSTVQVEINNIDAARLRRFWKHYRANDTYNLTNRNCSSAVADALDAALEGVYRDHRWPVFRALQALVFPELWAAGLMRKRAESMAWTPGLVLDYARALSALVDHSGRPPTKQSFHLVKKYSPRKSKAP
ncbi:HdeD family acid-resistance protein [Brucella thiophenivorans]|uniref:HdeD family acid-resistance protein n=1 Tax=Brucella thiophenivorans TaxID=571255 RepID=UPI001F4788FC|nr:protease [Brucella thiophenivorans]